MVHDRAKARDIIDRFVRQKATIVRLEGEMTHLNRENQDLVTFIEDTNQMNHQERLIYQERVGKLQQEVTELKLDNMKLEKMREVASSDTMGQMSQYGQQRVRQDKVERDNEALRKECAELRKRLNRAGVQPEEVASIVAAKQDAEARLKDAIVKLEKLSYTTLDERTRSNALRTEVDLLKQELQHLESEYNKNTRHYENLLKDVKNVSEHHKHNMEAMLNDALSRMTRTQHSPQVDFQHYDRLISQMSQDLRNAQNEVASLRSAQTMPTASPLAPSAAPAMPPTYYSAPSPLRVASQPLQQHHQHSYTPRRDYASSSPISLPSGRSAKRTYL